MGARFDLVTLDAVDSVSLARFWSDALGLVEVEREDNGRWIVLAEVDSGSRRMGIQRIVGLTAASAGWEGNAKGRIHLDLACSPQSFEDEVARLVACGAVLVRAVRREAYGSIATMVDPEGNIFDLCAYQ